MFCYLAVGRFFSFVHLFSKEHKNRIIEIQIFLKCSFKCPFFLKFFGSKFFLLLDQGFVNNTCSDILFIILHH